MILVLVLLRVCFKIFLKDCWFCCCRQAKHVVRVISGDSFAKIMSLMLRNADCAANCAAEAKAVRCIECEQSYCQHLVEKIVTYHCRFSQIQPCFPDPYRWYQLISQDKTSHFFKRGQWVNKKKQRSTPNSTLQCISCPKNMVLTLVNSWVSWPLCRPSWKAREPRCGHKWKTQRSTVSTVFAIFFLFSAIIYN